jgi:hypothetical protein
MKPRNRFIFPVFMIGLLALSLACAALTGGKEEPTPTATRPTEQSAPPTKPPPQVNNNSSSNTNSNNNSGSSNGWIIFTDQNNLYQIQAPEDWVYQQITGDHYYIDQFKSPDEKALVENIVYDEGAPFLGSQHGKFALELLNRFYSNTGEVGDIRVTGDQIQPDGSERLEWLSKSGGYSGFSYFEVRGADRTTFLMITIEWVNSAEDQYLEILNSIIESYSIP